MKKAVIVPDSFKGTVSSERICEIFEEKINKIHPDCEVVKIPVADGGEGSVNCFLNALGGEKIFVEVSGPYGEKSEAFYAVINGDTAVIEMAACAGLPLVEGRKNPMCTTTFGVGEMMLDAAKRGCEKIIMCLGGSCTNDLGAGAAAAVGIKFYNAKGEAFVPTGGTLCEIERIDTSSKNEILSDVKITAMCDIDNPLYGKSGAAYVFAPQKGADEIQVKLLDDGLRHTAEILKRDLSADVAELPGGGAAGGMGAGMAAFFGARLKSGIETVLDTVNFSEKITGADVIFTGEGKLDSQSLRGKVVSGVAKRAGEKGVPVIAVVGGYEAQLQEIYDMGVKAVFATNPLPLDFEKVRHKSEENLAATVENILRAFFS
ncbi:MAG: glycerate kinase [Clostridia bacterium]|nr:glycerate kinase [Clostridia bacterium]